MTQLSELPAPADGLVRQYWRKLLIGLVSEAESWAKERPSLTAVAASACSLLETFSKRADHAIDDEYELQGQYRTVAKQLALCLIADETIAMSYESMEQFWEDAGRQARGESLNTFWDVYEHGARRRLEMRIAELYGAEDAILVNSGMSAIALALESVSLRQGDSILAEASSYFETTDLLNQVYRCRGVIVVHPENRVASNADEPKVAILEAANATPGASGGHSSRLLDSIGSKTRLIVDNSFYGPAVQWCQIAHAHRSALFVESTAKFLCRSVMGGVIYGAREAITAVRGIARSSGQQLQASAFHHIRTGELDAAVLRLQIHSRNAQALIQSVCDLPFLKMCTLLTPNFETVATAAPAGCLVFLRVRPLPDISAAELHRKILRAWRDRASRLGLHISIRAGYGWDETTARCYEGLALKQTGVEDYMRISVGIQIASDITALGRALAASIKEVCHV